MLSQVVIYDVQDLFFQARIEQISKSLGASVLQANSLGELNSILHSAPKTLVVLDLAKSKSELTQISDLCSKLGSEILGYYSHVDTQTSIAAVNAGIRNITPKSGLHKKLSNLMTS
ncbi:MAG: hypothetical protein JRN15_07600 [Nitrososphaerota archaeon]|nr:hypothetical protein [Nitrososphaerota archaeon]